MPIFPFTQEAHRSSVSATRSRQSVSSLYFHWIAVPLFRTSGSAVLVFAALLHPMASTLQSTNRATQSAKSVPVSSFFPVFIFFPPLGIVITAEFCTAARAVNERRLTGLCLVCFVLIHEQGNPLL